MLVKYSQKFSQPFYHDGKVIKTLENEKNLVKDVVVATRNRRHKEKEDHQVVPVQRSVLLLPAEDRDSPLDQPSSLNM